MDSRTGELSVKSRFTRTQPKLVATNGVFNVLVEAYKEAPFRHLSANVTVQISVISVNLHRPTFSATRYILAVTENPAIGTVLQPTTNTKITLNDADPVRRSSFLNSSVPELLFILLFCFVGNQRFDESNAASIGRRSSG